MKEQTHIKGYRVLAVDKRGQEQHRQDFLLKDHPDAATKAKVHAASIINQFKDCTVTSNVIPKEVQQ